MLFGAFSGVINLVVSKCCNFFQLFVSSLDKNISCYLIKSSISLHLPKKIV